MFFDKVFDKSVAKPTGIKNLKKMKHYFCQPVFQKRLFFKALIFNTPNSSNAFCTKK